MSKKTRLGLALGTTVALSLSSLTAVPAFAADDVTLVPSAGTTYNSLLQAGITLESEINPTLSADAGTLTWKITNSAKRQLSVAVTTSAADAGQTLYNAADAEAGSPISGETPLDSDASGASAAAADSAGAVIVTVDDSDAPGDADQGANSIDINTSYTSGDVTLKVQSWLDTNGDGIIGTFETKSIERTVVLYKASNVTPTTSFVQAPERGIEDWSAKVTTNKDINLEQLGSDVTVNLYRNGTEIDDASAAFDDDKDALYTGAESDADADLTGTFKVRAEFNGSAWGEYSASSTSVSGSNSDVNGAYVVESGLDTANVLYTDSEEFQLRSGTKALDFAVQVEDADGEDLDAAGVKVRAVLSDSTLSDGTIVKSGGKTLTDGGDAITVETSTNAEGVAKFSLSTTVGEDGEAIDFYIEVLTTDGWEQYTSSSFPGDRADSGSIYWEDARVDSFLNGMISGNDSDFITTVTKGGNIGLNYEIRDQWGQLATSDLGTFKIEIDNDGGVNGNDDFTKRYAVSGGKLSVNLKDESTELGSYSVYASLYELDDDGITYVSASGYNYEEANIVVEVVENAVPKTIDSTISLEETTYADIEGVELTNYDGRTKYDGHGWDLTYYEYDDYSNVSGTVYNADGDVVPGAKVTLSAAAGAVLFIDDEWYVFSKDSITVTADADGYFYVDVVSNRSGDNVISITSGSASTTEKLVVASPTESEATTLTLKAPSIATAGSVVNVAASLADKWGNVVESSDINWDSTGSGYLSASTTATSASGKPANVKLITGATESGVTTVTATSDYDSDITASIDVLVGVSASSKATAATVYDIAASVKNASGATVKVYVGGKLKATKVATSNAFSFKVASGTSGNKLVSIYVNGVRINSAYKLLK
ncbi:carboxypeptidase-like regulatory domain-containing protein [Rhodoluna limnophila]|uniref:carboxypeptidase-like regulatory domain-containing protein n=1 Tax=Rhodoluna limnophila TaxID=232537 RepID=UPI001106359D|nr:carboxypeptidase-like regulatory domain-containing protein [Rhodoluna limnophila]